MRMGYSTRWNDFFFIFIVKMSSEFKASPWIFVGDFNICPHSEKQVQICKNMGLQLKGAILCHEKDQASSEACKQVPAFPAFCNTESNLCVAGLRETKDHFRELQKLSDEQLAKTKHK